MTLVMVKTSVSRHECRRWRNAVGLLLLLCVARVGGHRKLCVTGEGL